MYCYSGEEAIRRSGPDTPVHILRTYKELCLLRRQCGDVINYIVSFIDNDDEYENVKIHSINNECFQFIQSLLSKWNRDENGASRPFGSRLSLRNNKAMSSLVASTLCTSFNQFQQNWVNLQNKIHKLVAKNIKSKKKHSCNCLTKNHLLNKTVVLFTSLPMTPNDGTMNICITWYVDCSYSFEYDDVDNCALVTWPLYEECVQGVDALANDLDECCQWTLSEVETSRDSLILQVPRQYANCALRPFLRVVIKPDASQKLDDGYHTIPNLTNELILECTTLFCRRGMIAFVLLVVIAYNSDTRKGMYFRRKSTLMCQSIACS